VQFPQKTHRFLSIVQVELPEPAIQRAEIPIDEAKRPTKRQSVGQEKEQSVQTMHRDIEFTAPSVIA